MSGSDLLGALFGVARRPSLAVFADGASVLGALAARIVSTNDLAADRFTLDVALSADPAMGAAFWADMTASQIDIRVAADAADVPASLILGQADLVELDPRNGLARIEGRDLAARLIEARTQETFSNRTSSEIATLLAQRHGLQAQVQSTSTPVGRYYANQHDAVTLDQFSNATTEWDLLSFLAQQEGFDLFVSGTTLFFQPPGSAVSAAIDLADTTRLELSRALTLTGGIEVTVKSWNSRDQVALVQTASNNGAAPSGAAARNYVLIRPNLTADQAQALANRTLAQVAAHERTLVAELPGDASLDARAPLTLTGTATSFDQTYAIAEIERRVDAARGFTMTVRAQSASTAGASS